MKLDKFTLAVLNSFSTINNSIVIKPGNELRIIPETKTILAEAMVPVKFEQEFGIYDLRKLLGCISVVDDPEIVFSDSFLEVVSGSGKTRIKYMYTDPARITAPTKRINLPSAEVEFDLSAATLENVMKSSGILSVEDLSFQSSEDSESVIVAVMDKNDPTSNRATFDVEGTSNIKFTANLKISNLKIIPGDYKVSLSSKGIALFSSVAHDLKYFIAIESDSSFE